ncbi:MAG: 30S ribosomal protein S20 [Bacteroidetes bacterium]|jgi:small subunit ribosomal protein S20|nr:30S ribosomal protein S20 [Bacteroidota bacterium]MBK9482836.1 30S ribosomal protein S20 [Bacteroidota bacterium]
MANHKATKKDTRQANKRRERNRYHGKTTRNAMRDLMAVSDEKLAAEKLPTVEAMLDKLAKRNIIHKNKAANLKSALAKKVNALSNPPAEVVAKPAKKAVAKKTATKKSSKK